MTEVQLETIDSSPVNFIGRLTCETEGQVEFPDGLTRMFRLKLYSVDSGGFVPSIEYASESSDEQSGCIAEIVDEFKDIENFFFVFVPEDLLPKATTHSRKEEDVHRKLSARMRKTYESLTFAFLDKLKLTFESQVDTATPESKTSESAES